jgi:exosortase
MNTSFFANRTSLLKIGFISALVIYVYYGEIQSLVFHWTDKKEYSHGFLIPLISGYVIWRERGQLKNTPLMPDMKGLLILIAGLILLLVGTVAFEPFMRQLSLIITIMGLLYLLLGNKMFKKLLFPSGYLIFMIPIPYIIMNTIAVNLRLISAQLTYQTLNFAGIPILRAGANLELPNISLVVADLCTGVLSLIAIMALAFFYAYIAMEKNITRLFLILLAVPIAVFSNIARLIMTVGLTYFIGPKVLNAFIHAFHGTVNFIITVFLLVLVAHFLTKVEMKFSHRASR